MIFTLGILILMVFYNAGKFKTFLIFVNKFKLLFISLVLFQLLLRRQGVIIYNLFFIKITDQGVFYGFNSLLRYLVILLSATMLGSASPYEMIKALRTWKLPEQVIITVSFTIQFLRQFQTDFKILNQNLKKRNLSFKGKSLKKRFDLASQLVIPVMGKTFSDIRYKVIAMELNGYGFHKNVKPFFYNKCKLKDYFVMIFVFMVIMMFLWFG